MRSGRLLLLVLALGLADTVRAEEPAPVDADPTEDVAEEDSPAAERLAERFAGSSILLEHSASVGNAVDLSPHASRVIARTWQFSLAFTPHEVLGLGLGLGIVHELTPSPTTYEREPLLDDLAISASLALPVPPGGGEPFSWSLGLGVGVPTSKASRAASLIVELSPSLGLAITAPLLDGLSFGYDLGPSPRLHRYTTSSTLEPIPCSPAAGCDLGRTTDTGSRNTAFQLSHDFSIALAALDSRLSASASLRLVYSRPYALSTSDRYPEEQISDPDNSGGSPTTLSSSFILDVGWMLHPGLGLSVGLWTPGGMAPDGSWYNPLGNRFSQVYVDLTVYLVEGVLAEARRARARRAAQAE